MKNVKLTISEHLLQLCNAIDQQVARELQRDPVERQEHGVSKQEPYRKRREMLSLSLLEAFSTGAVNIDGMLVVTESLAKTLEVITEELGSEGLGKYRSSDLLKVSRETSLVFEKISDQISGKKREVLN